MNVNKLYTYTELVLDVLVPWLNTILTPHILIPIIIFFFIITLNFNCVCICIYLKIITVFNVK